MVNMRYLGNAQSTSHWWVKSCSLCLKAGLTTKDNTLMPTSNYLDNLNLVLMLYWIIYKEQTCIQDNITSVNKRRNWFHKVVFDVLFLWETLYVQKPNSFPSRVFQYLLQLQKKMNKFELIWARICFKEFSAV